MRVLKKSCNWANGKLKSKMHNNSSIIYRYEVEERGFKNKEKHHEEERGGVGRRGVEGRGK